MDMASFLLGVVMGLILYILRTERKRNYSGQKSDSRMSLHDPKEIEYALQHSMTHAEYMRNLIQFVLCGDIKEIRDELTGKKYSIKIEEIKEENGHDN